VYGTCDGDNDSDDAAHQMTYTITGLVGHDTTTGRAVIKSNAPEPGPAGTYAIAVTKGTLAASANYTFQFVPGTLTITPAVLTVAAQNVNTSYGAQGGDEGHDRDTDPCRSELDRDDGGCAIGRLGYTVTGLVNGDNSRVYGGQPTLSTTAAANSGAGTYAIVVGLGTFHASANYTIRLVNGTVTIAKAVIEITADNASRKINTANPAFAYDLEGLVKGDSKAVISGAPALTTTALVNSPSGKYPIVASLGTLSAANYTFAFENGSLSVLGSGDRDDHEGGDGHDGGH
jgi:hypothetical protein